MPGGWGITGEVDIWKLAADLQQVGHEQLRRDVYRRLGATVKTLKTAVRKNAATVLPHTGGLAGRVEAASYRTKFAPRGSGGLTIHLTVEDRPEHGKHLDLNVVDGGRIRHPTYGHEPFVTQTIPRGWFDTPWRRHKNEVGKALRKTLDDAAARLRRG